MRIRPRPFNHEPIVRYAALAIIVLLSVFVGWPILKTFELSLTTSAGLAFDHYFEIFSKEWLRKSFINSILLGITTATISVVIGYIFAFLVARTRVRGKNYFRFAATLPIISPPFMLSLSAILLFGRNGAVTRFLGIEDFSIYGFHGLVLVQTMSMFPLAYLTILGVLQGISISLEDAALNLGASKWNTFKDITFPLALPGVFSAWLIIFVTSLADFATPMLLSGRFDVLSVQAYLQFTGSGNLPMGAALSSLLLIPCAAAYIFQKYFVQRRSYVTVTGKPQTFVRDLTAPWVRNTLAIFGILFSAFILIMYGTVLAGCLTKNWGIDYSFSLDAFRYVWEVGRSSIADTITLSAIATPITAVIGLISAYLVIRKSFVGKKFLDLFAMLPLALPGTAIGIGYVLAFNSYPILLTGTASILVIAFIFRNIPVVLENAKASLLQIDPSIEEAATNLGASSPRVFWEITLPMIKPAIFSGMAYTFVHCMTAVSAVIFIVSSDWNHMTVLTLNQTENLRFSAASVLCLIMISSVLLVFGIMRLLIGKNLMHKEVIE